MDFTWSVSLRSLWRVHPMPHCDVIAALSDQLPIKVSLERRCIRFINNVYLVLIP